MIAETSDNNYAEFVCRNARSAAQQLGSAGSNSTLLVGVWMVTGAVSLLGILQLG